MPGWDASGAAASAFRSPGRRPSAGTAWGLGRTGLVTAGRIPCFRGFTVVGLLMRGASFWRALSGTLAQLALRVPPVQHSVIHAIGAVIVGLGILQWRSGIIIPR